MLPLVSNLSFSHRFINFPRAWRRKRSVKFTRALWHPGIKFYSWGRVGYNQPFPPLVRKIWWDHAWLIGSCNRIVVEREMFLITRQPIPSGSNDFPLLLQRAKDNSDAENGRLKMAFCESGGLARWRGTKSRWWRSAKAQLDNRRRRLNCHLWRIGGGTIRCTEVNWGGHSLTAMWIVFSPVLGDKSAGVDRVQKIQSSYHFTSIIPDLH